MPVEAVNAGRSVVIGVDELAEKATFQNEAGQNRLTTHHWRTAASLVSKQVNRSEQFGVLRSAKSATGSRAFVLTILAAAVFRSDRRQTGGWHPAGQPEYAGADCTVEGVGGSE